MIKEYRRLVKNFVLLGLRELNKRKNYLEEIPEPENELEQKAFSQAISVIISFVAEEPGARETVLYIIHEY